MTVRIMFHLRAIIAEPARGVDVVVRAGAPREPPCITKVPNWGNLFHSGFNQPSIVSGWPAMCVCSGYGEGGLSAAVKNAGKPFQVAAALEKATNPGVRCPPIGSTRADGVPAGAGECIPVLSLEMGRHDGIRNEDKEVN